MPPLSWPGHARSKPASPKRLEQLEGLRRGRLGAAARRATSAPRTALSQRPPPRQQGVPLGHVRRPAGRRWLDRRDRAVLDVGARARPGCAAACSCRSRWRPDEADELAGADRRATRPSSTSTSVRTAPSTCVQLDRADARHAGAAGRRRVVRQEVVREGGLDVDRLLEQAGLPRKASKSRPHLGVLEAPRPRRRRRSGPAWYSALASHQRLVELGRGGEQGVGGRRRDPRSAVLVALGGGGEEGRGRARDRSSSSRSLVSMSGVYQSGMQSTWSMNGMRR